MHTGTQFLPRIDFNQCLLDYGREMKASASRHVILHVLVTWQKGDQPASIRMNRWNSNRREHQRLKHQELHYLFASVGIVGIEIVAHNLNLGRASCCSFKSFLVQDESFMSARQLHNPRMTTSAILVSTFA